MYKHHVYCYVDNFYEKINWQIFFRKNFSERNKVYHSFHIRQVHLVKKLT